MPYRSLWVAPTEQVPFRIRVKEKLGPKRLERMGMVGVIFAMGSPLLLMFVGIPLGNSLPLIAPLLAMLGMFFGVALGVGAQVINLGWHGYWHQDD